MEGIERIKKMAKGQEDKALNKVVNYLITRDDMNKKYLSEEKSLKGMCEFVQEQAKEKSTNAGWNCFEDEEVFNWAIHYFDESNEKLGINKKEVVVQKSIDSIKKENTKKETDLSEQMQFSLF